MEETAGQIVQPQFNTFVPTEEQVSASGALKSKDKGKFPRVHVALPAL